MYPYPPPPQQRPLPQPINMQPQPSQPLQNQQPPPHRHQLQLPSSNLPIENYNQSVKLPMLNIQNTRTPGLSPSPEVIRKPELRKAPKINQTPEIKKRPEVEESPKVKNTCDANDSEVKENQKTKDSNPLSIKKESDKCCTKCRSTTPVAIDFTSSYKSDSPVPLQSAKPGTTKSTLNRPSVTTSRDKSPGMSIGGLLNDK
mmetsp:Transcript_7107/g.8996  ORF Transcript_7107/g.8996 Transcript_7107/m.8996 type:complete len:201 (-) Transcript_7107:76-678(-)